MYTQLYQIKKHLNIDDEWHDDDEYLVQLAEVCEKVVEKTIDTAFETLEDGDGMIPSPLLHAVLVLVANYYANRESIAFVQAASLPHSFQYLIDLYRDYRGPRSEKVCPCRKKEDEEGKGQHERTVLWA